MEPLGPLQLRCMLHIWAHGPSTVHQVHDNVNATRPKKEHLAYTTYLTVLRSLVKRGVLLQSAGEEQAPAKRHIFTSTITKMGYAKLLLRGIRDDLFNSDVRSLMSYCNNLDVE